MIFQGKLGWNFPSNDDGQEDALNDPGIEAYKDIPLSSVAREGLQNSADASDTRICKLIHAPTLIPFFPTLATTL